MVEFSHTAKTKFDEIVSRYPRKEAALLPTLWLAQEEFTTVTPEVMAYVAALLDLPAAKVLGVTTFYTMYHTKPVGTYHIQVCRTLSCAMAGSNALLDYLKKTFNVDLDELTADGKFTISQVECLANCDAAPAIQINATDYKQVSQEKMGEILKKLP